MEELVGLFLLDTSNNIIEEDYIRKPKSFSQLLDYVPKTFKGITEYYNIFYLSNNNEEIFINNDKDYQLSKDILFIRDLKNDYFNKSLFEINYDKLSESKQELLDEKYNCYICNEQIKNEKPLL